MGIIPTIMAKLVINTGRKRRATASRADFKASPLCLRSSSALVINSTALDMDTPTDMIIPMYDCRLSVAPVNFTKNNEPNNTAGTVDNTTNDILNDWKLAASIKNITITATNSPVCKLSKVSVSVLLMPRCSTVKPRGSLPRCDRASLTSLVAVPRSLLLILAVTDSIGTEPISSFSPYVVPVVISATSLNTGRAWLASTGISRTSLRLAI